MVDRFLIEVHLGDTESAEVSQRKASLGHTVSLCVLGVLCASVVDRFLIKIHLGDTESAEVSQRKASLGHTVSVCIFCILWVLIEIHRGLNQDTT